MMQPRYTSVAHSILTVVASIVLFTATVIGSAVWQTAGPPPQVADPKPGPAQVSGTVVDAATGQPIPEALVSLSRPVARRQVTDASGRFVFADLPTGDRYSLSVTASGYLDAPSTMLVVGNAGVKDRRIALNRAASLSGRVVDDSGQPIVGAYVRALTRIWIGGRQQYVAGPFARTDDRGSYWIGGLRPGDYTVLVPSIQRTIPAAADMQATFTWIASAKDAGVFQDSGGLVGLPGSTAFLLTGGSPIAPAAADGRLQVYPPAFYPASRTTAQAGVVTLASGEDRAGVDIVVRPEPAVRVSGRLVGATDVGGRTVRLLLPGAEELDANGEVASTVSDTLGRFTFIAVPPGDYVVSVRNSEVGFATGMDREFFGLGAAPRTQEASGSIGLNATTTGARFRYSVDSSRSYIVRRRLSVAADRDDVVLPLESGGSLSGTIRWDNDQRGMISAILAWPVGDSMDDVATAVARPDASAFELTGLADGRYVIGPFGGARVKSFVCGNVDVTNRPVTIRSSEPMRDCVMTLTADSTTLSGTVTDRSGAPIEDAVVLVFPAEREQWTDYGPAPARIRALNINNIGAFTVTGLPAGDYLVAVLPIRYRETWQEPGMFNTLAPQAARVRLEWNGTATVGLTLVQR